MAILSFSELEARCNEQNKAVYEIAQEEEALLSETEVNVVRIKVLEDLLAMKEAVKKAGFEVTGIEEKHGLFS